MQRFLLIVLALALPLGVVAQTAGGRADTYNDAEDPYKRLRPEDYFWSKRVLMRVMLQEKINAPLAPTSNSRDNYANGEGGFGEHYTQGLVHALIHAWKEGKITPYDAETFEVKTGDEANYQWFVDNDAKIRGTDPDAPATDGGDTAPADGGDPFGDDIFGGGGDDPFGDFGDFGDDFGDFGDDFGTPVEDPASGDAVGGTESNELNLEDYNIIVEIVEDRIFDKIRGDMVYKIRFIRIIWSNETTGLADRAVVAFKYDEKDTRDVLANTLWYNRNNDAESKTMLQVLEQRRFRGFITYYGSDVALDINESERFKKSIIQFEHHLWSF